MKSLKTFYIFQGGQFVSMMGSNMTAYALVLWAYAQSGSVLSLSLLSLCTLIPSISLSFIAGAISDNWNKKKVMIISDSIGAIGTLVVLILLITGNLRIYHLYVINILLGIAGAFQHPAAEVTISTIVAKEDFLKISGVRSFCNAFLQIFNPILATAIFSFGGLSVVFVIDLTSFLFAVSTLAFLIKIPEKQINTDTNDNIPKSILKDKIKAVFNSCTQGFRWLFNNKGILALILFMSFVNLEASMYACSLAPMVLSRTGNNTIQLGLVSGTVGIAGLVGSFLVTRIKPRVKNGKPQRASLIISIITFSFLCCDSMLGLGRNFIIWIFAVFLGNVFIPILSGNCEYFMRTDVPLEMQGRVFATRNTLQFGTQPIGTLLAGILADKVLEPLMSNAATQTGIVKFYSLLVGSGKGAGLGLMYLFMGVIGGLGCFAFRFWKPLTSLDK